MTTFLIVATAVIAILGLFTDRVPARYKAAAVVVAVALILASVFAQLSMNYRQARSEVLAADRQARNEAIAALSGTLRSSVRSSARFPVLMLCETSVQFTSGGPTFTFIEDPVFMRMQDGEAKVSLIVRDHLGMIRAYIRDNVWFVPRSEGVFDRNYSRDALEVVGPRGEVFLQIKIEGEKVRLVMTGYTKKGEGPTSFAPCRGTRQTMFKYPSSEFLGEFEPGR